MFTGLTQSIGTLHPAGASQVEVHCPELTATLALGDSVAVDGVCLTVAECLPQGFLATTSPETLARTTLAHKLNTQHPVNLELALRVGDRLGGHFVTGHIDGVGETESLSATETSWLLSFTVPDAIAAYVIPKGSIAVNGVSLTIADCNLQGNWFQVAVIPHSFSMTNLRYLQPHTLVNIETDVLGKYVAKFLRYPPEAALDFPVAAPKSVSPDFLAEHGYV
ncbi:riboflavin synthase [Synechococcales cyanobacterium C]|uniref:Riboflavin synthase n=1 Tax=Petrachloros mirabilis ULC683 TaxID=2781853 RepID=A0A8K1ZZC6_9CYAN|nr:riboflavin synthase [Petrachloros mirabilis ULC683]